MPPKDTLVVNKISLSYKPIDHPQSFGRYEQLYLELIENKIKIKQNLINKDYEPSGTTFHHEPLSKASPSDGGIALSPATSSSEGESFKLLPKDDTNKDDDSVISERLSKLDQQIGSEPDHHEQEHAIDSFDNQSIQSNSTSSFKPTPNPASTAVSNKLQDLLARRGGVSNPKHDIPHPAIVEQEPDSRFEEYQRSRKRLPTLSELEKQGATVNRRELADAARLEIEDEDMKRELLFKFDLLRKSYKEQNIPTFTIHSDVNMMARSYEDTVRRLSLDSSVETYKRYLIGAFMLIEFALGKWLKFDMKGYTQQQIVSMSSYEKLLIEIGEKSYVSGGEQWSVEVRLLFLIIINTAFFLVGKMIMNNTGSNLMSAINSMNRAVPEQAPKKKMQGPNINLDDLPDINQL